MAEYREEQLNLGAQLGTLRLRQMTADAWNRATLASESEDCDATGALCVHMCMLLQACVRNRCNGKYGPLLRCVQG